MMVTLVALGVLLVKPSSGPRLVNVTESRTNGTLTAIGFEWDMGDRRVREIRLGATAQADGLAEPLTRTTLRVRFAASGKDRANATLEWRTHGPRSSGTSTTRGEIAVDGGLATIRRPSVDFTKPAGKLVLLRWNDRRAKVPPALTVTFR